MTDLERIAYKTERAASRRLAQSAGLSADEALRRTLERVAGTGGLAALIALRTGMLAAQAAREAARAAEKAAAAARRAHLRDARPTAWRAWFDGSARPNPGRCGIGALLEGPGGIKVELAQPAGHGNSSEAEYRALIALLEAAVAHGARDLTIHGDSRVVIDDVNGPDLYAAPALAAYRARVQALLVHLPDARLRWVPRHRNAAADALSQRAFATESTLDTIATSDESC